MTEEDNTANNEDSNNSDKLPFAPRFDHAPTMDEITRDLLERIDKHDVNPLARDALKKMVEATRKANLIDDDIDSLIAKLQSPLWDTRLKATQQLLERGDERAVEPLIRALKDSWDGVRDWAALALGKIGDVRAVEPLIETFTQSPKFV